MYNIVRPGRFLLKEVRYTCFSTHIEPALGTNVCWPPEIPVVSFYSCVLFKLGFWSCQIEVPSSLVNLRTTGATVPRLGWKCEGLRAGILL